MSTESPSLDPADVLSDAPPVEDLAVALRRQRERRRISKLTVVLAAAVLLALGFAGGALVRGDQSQTATGPAAFGGGAAGAGPAGGFPRAGGGVGAPTGAGATPGAGDETGAGSPISGTVKLVDGAAVYVETADGITKVMTDGSTTVRATTPTDLAALAAGDTVSIDVAEPAASDGPTSTVAGGDGTAASQSEPAQIAQTITKEGTP